MIWGLSPCSPLGCAVRHGPLFLRFFEDLSKVRLVPTGCKMSLRGRHDLFELFPCRDSRVFYFLKKYLN